jgi:hypothetical protein
MLANEVHRRAAFPNGDTAIRLLDKALDDPGVPRTPGIPTINSTRPGDTVLEAPAR